MRLQLMVFALAVMAGGHLVAQNTYVPETVVAEQPADTNRPAEPVEIDFLAGYYEQDGNRSAVTGGEGTQELRDRQGIIVVNIPLDSVSRLQVNTAVNYYSSASTDRINSITSASAHDYHAQLNVAYEKDENAQRLTYGFNAGGSLESDYISTWLGAKWDRTSADGNRVLGLKAQAFFDTWLLIFPDELRSIEAPWADTDQRQSFQLTGTWSQVINQRWRVALTVEGGYQRGLLSTPFHRVYFLGVEQPGIETLPDNRWKLPLGLRSSYYLGDRIILRSFYRFYTDNWGIYASTASLEVPVKLTPFFSVYPFYRYHTQSGATYFQGFGRHDPTADYFTSDYDLSAFDSHKFGGGVRFAPVWGIGRFRLGKSLANFKSLSVRYAHYRRGDGLRANMVTLSASFRID